MQRLGRWVLEQVRHIEGSDLVFEDGFAALEDHGPVIHSSAQGVLASQPGDGDVCLLDLFS